MYFEAAADGCILKSERGTEFRFSRTEITPSGDGGIFCGEGILPTPRLLPGDRLLLPIDEGVAVPVEETDFSMQTPFCCREAVMSMIIIERGGDYLLIALDSGTDASYDVHAAEGSGGPALLTLTLSSESRCRVLYRITDHLGEACRAYREFHHPAGVRSLKEKFSACPEGASLCGSAIFWIWNDDYEKVMYSDKDCDLSPLAGDSMTGIAEELRQSGIDRALFGIFFEPDGAAAAELTGKYGYLTVKYDNYNDVPPADLLNFIPKKRVEGCDYAARRIKDYPDGVQINEDGTMRDAWALRGFDGKLHPQNTLCPVVAARRMLEEIPAAHEKYPAMSGYFIDVFGGTVTACYSDKHPMTKKECVKLKKETFCKLSEMGYLIGTEDGFDDILDGILYTEGLHSPFPFRYDKYNCGRRKAQQLGAEGADFQRGHMLNPACRVPLWELAYHDASFSFPYWGDSTACVTETLDDKILFARLYAAPPLFSFFAGDFPMLKEKIIGAYGKIREVTGAVGLCAMTDFRYLTDDRMVQKTVFEDGSFVIANFSDSDYSYQNIHIPPHDSIFCGKTGA
ncbi:MAG: glycoside hydrolase [Clostridia bacterium]|nr:glycoside hydrolase [Clostridia bacterium]